MTVIRPVDDSFKETLDYRAICLADNTSCYNDEVARIVFRVAKGFLASDEISEARFLRLYFSN